MQTRGSLLTGGAKEEFPSLPAPYSTTRKGWWLEWSWVVGTDAAGRLDQALC